MLSDLELLNSAEKDLEWFQENSEKIRDEFARKIIAIKDKKVIASAEDINELLQILKAKKVDSSEVLTEAIVPKGEITIL